MFFASRKRTAPDGSGRRAQEDAFSRSADDAHLAMRSKQGGQGVSSPVEEELPAGQGSIPINRLAAPDMRTPQYRLARHRTVVAGGNVSQQEEDAVYGAVPRAPSAHSGAVPQGSGSRNESPAAASTRIGGTGPVSLARSFLARAPNTASASYSALPSGSLGSRPQPPALSPTLSAPTDDARAREPVTNTSATTSSPIAPLREVASPAGGAAMNTTTTHRHSPSTSPSAPARSTPTATATTTTIPSTKGGSVTQKSGTDVPTANSPKGVGASASAPPASSAGVPAGADDDGWGEDAVLAELSAPIEVADSSPFPQPDVEGSLEMSDGERKKMLEEFKAALAEYSAKQALWDREVERRLLLLGTTKDAAHEGVEKSQQEMPWSNETRERLLQQMPPEVVEVLELYKEQVGMYNRRCREWQLLQKMVDQAKARRALRVEAEARAARSGAHSVQGVGAATASPSHAVAGASGASGAGVARGSMLQRKSSAPVLQRHGSGHSFSPQQPRMAGGSMLQRAVGAAGSMLQPRGGSSSSQSQPSQLRRTQSSFLGGGGSAGVAGAPVVAGGAGSPAGNIPSPQTAPSHKGDPPALRHTNSAPNLQRSASQPGVQASTRATGSMFSVAGSALLQTASSFIRPSSSSNDASAPPRRSASRSGGDGVVSRVLGRRSNSTVSSSSHAAVMAASARQSANSGRPLQAFGALAGGRPKRSGDAAAAAQAFSGAQGFGASRSGVAAGSVIQAPTQSRAPQQAPRNGASVAVRAVEGEW